MGIGGGNALNFSRRRTIEFARQLETISTFLAAKGHRHALAGALALAAYGLPRTTLDLDIVVEASARPNIVAFLEGLGYTTLYQSAGYSNHVHSDPSLPRVDFIYVDEKTGHRLFEAAKRFPGPAGREVLVPKPEHLAAMKVLAMKNDPTRRFQDMADIRFLMTLPATDKEEIRDSFERYGLGERFRELEEGV